MLAISRGGRSAGAGAGAGGERVSADGGGNRAGSGRRRSAGGVPGTRIVTAPGSARTRTGSSPIGSPSAYIVNGRSELMATS